MLLVEISQKCQQIQADKFVIYLYSWSNIEACYIMPVINQTEDALYSCLLIKLQHMWDWICCGTDGLVRFATNRKSGLHPDYQQALMGSF